MVCERCSLEAFKKRKPYIAELLLRTCDHEKDQSVLGQLASITGRKFQVNPNEKDNIKDYLNCSLTSASSIIPLLAHPDNETRFCAHALISDHFELSDSERLDLKVKYQVGDFQWQDLVEKQNQIQSYFDTETEQADLELHHTVAVGSVLIKRLGPSVLDNTLITTPFEGAMDKIGLAIDLKMPVLVQGPPGSGKTTLLEHCANRVGAKLIKIHLGDQTDAKLLLGTYVSTNQPGLFQWQDGLLTRAVLEGDWLLVEDIDMAPADVLAVFVPLLETRTLFIASRGQRLQAHENFMIFSTTTAQAESLGGNLWTRAVLEAPDQEQTEKIMKHRFPQLENVSGLLFSVFCDLKQKMIDARVSRPLSLRDLFKWCQRVSKIQKDEQHALEDAFQHGCDLFLALVPKYELRRQLVLDFGVQLGLTEHRIDFLTIGYRPQYERSGNKLVLGKCQLETSAVEKPSQFASTGPSLRLLEQIAISIENHEPLLLVGETGTGKTTTVQRLAGILGKKLVVMNMSQQSDSTDLLGGFKPIDQIQYVIPVKQTFDTLFQKTFPSKSNQAFTDTVNKAFIKKKWNHLLTGFNNAIKMANKIMKSSEPNPTKKRKLDPSLLVEWDNFAIQAKQLEQQLEQMGSNMLFSFVQGALVKAMEQGDWILLDEINLATPETLETLSSLLQDPKGSLLLLERGDTNQIKRHPDFRLFGCMNPANDAGKRDLAISLRSRFTELWVDAPDRELSDLLLIISTYLGTLVPPGPQGDQFLNSIAQFYQSAKKLSQEGRLFDGANQRQHISMRTLTRALVCTATNASTYGLVRSLYEGLYMTFMTSLNQDSFDRLMPVLADTILKDIKQPTKFVKQIPRQNNDNQVLVDCYWLEKGPIEPEESTSFILTPFVERNLNNVARACLSSLPILIQGPTSAGKTSIIEYLAKRTGHRFIRINNHEHTDLQEYLGGYISNEQGHLVFQEGILVQALKQGHWIVLDELNLAPSDVLESLNRLLDDNRELFIPETQQTVKPHKDFRLFATQNPPGLYGGRKQLSRAFRNRFLELHFTDIPQSELETILEKRCLIAPSYCKALVKVYNQLAQRRDQLKIFSGKDSFVTLRDLFRWAMRKADSYTQLGRDGYMILGEKCRMQEEREMIMQVIEKELRVKLDMDNWYLETFQSVMKTIGSTVESFNMNIVWTFAMQRLFVIVWKAVEFGEPLLLVGETGCGKTTVIQVISQLLSRKLHIVNAHQNSEVSDFVGSQRPFRQREQVQEQLKKRLHDLGQPCEDLKQIEAYLHNNPDPELTKMLRQSKALFEWHDGPLVQALVDGDLFLLDEISLADDSVLERLNSVLEPQKLLVLVEKNSAQVQEITGHANFHFFATMNPGGDYGKKELSPALRNRFTEVWVPSVSDRDDLLMIMSSRMSFETSQFWASRVLDFLEWFAQELKRPLESIASLRDILSWSDFIAKMQLSKPVSFYHGGLLVVVDGLGVNPLYGLVGDTKHLREKCVQKLLELGGSEDALPSTDGFSLGPFSIPFGQEPTKTMQFALQAQTTNMNCMRVLRALQLKKPVLLEGSPGVGKTSLIVSLSKMTRHRIVRINLSEQTDLMDLFGSDLPVEGGEAGSFEWRDGPFLEAMKSGAWVLLDELNLASQQVLEGLNACLDHRATVYVPELDREFPSHPEFRVFACQNPQHQGGGRKGLPKSFVNRFAQVYVDALQLDDLVFICQSLYPQYQDLAERMIQFNEHVREEIMVSKSFGFQGAPWEFNLRDVLRWMQLLHANNSNDPTQFFQMLYVQRMRNKEDRVHVQRLLSRWFESKYQPPTKFEMTPETFTIGNAQLKRLGSVDRLYDLEILPSKLSLLESLVHCINTRTMALLVGPPSSGKSSLIRLLSSIRGSKLVEFSMNPSIDALELLGGFEQVDLNRQFYAIVEDFELKSRQLVKELLKTSLEEAQKVYDQSLRLSKLRLEDGLQPLKDYFDFLRQYLEFDASALGHLQQLMDKGVQGQFEWMDSILIEALEKGHWIALDNCNLCSASVLDRLNSLLEFDGFLSINERGLVDGQVKTIKPHPNFRIFMLMDPRHGEVSRAMRNRSIELFVDLEWNKMDCIRIYTALGLPGDAYKLFDGIETGKAQFLFEQMVRGKQVQLKRSLATSSPDAVSGRLWITDSKQASLLIQASVLIHQLMDQDPVMVSTDTVEHVLEESLLSFLCANISERLQFLKQLEPTALEMHKPFLHQWIQSLENTTEHPDRILQARHWMLIQHQNQILQETKTLKRNQMTMAHQVCALQLSRLNKTQLVHPSLQFVFELYQAFQQLMDSHQATRSMLQWLTNMWRCLLESNMGVFLYCLETLLKISPRSNFYNTLLKMSHVLDLESLLQSNQLWKRDFVSTLHSLDLFELYQQIQSLDQQTLLIHSKTRDWYLQSCAWKTILMEGASTVFYLDSHKDQQLLETLKATISKLELEGIESESLLLVDQLQTRQAQIALYPVYDWMVLKRMQDILQGSQAKLEYVEQSSLNALVLEPFNRARWQSQQKTLEMELGFHRGLWSSLYHHKPDQRIFDGQLLEILEEDIPLEKTMRITGPLSHVLFSLLRIQVPCYSFESKHQSLQKLLPLLDQPLEWPLLEIESSLDHVQGLDLTPIKHQSGGWQWIQLGITFLDHYVPSVCWDPVSGKQAQLQHLERELQGLRDHLIVTQEQQYLYSGTMDSLESKTIQDQITQKEQEIQDLRKYVSLRPEQPMIQELYNDLLELKQTCHSISNIKQSELGEREPLMQQILESFAKKLDSYVYYRDLTLPCQLSIYHIKYGLRLLQPNDLKLDLFGFHETHQLYGFKAQLDFVLSQKLDTQLELLICLQQRLQAVKPQGYLSLCAEMYDRMIDLWILEEDQKRKKEQEEQSLYKVHKIETDEEMEEKELMRMFPDHEQEMPMDLFETRSKRIFRLFLSLQQPIDVKTEWTESYLNLFKSGIEMDCGKGFWFVCQQLIQQLSVDEQVMDFYNDSNPYEARLIGPLMLNLDQMLQKPLGMWPEHAVLLELRQMTRKIASFSITSPTMKFLTALEQLLQKSQDWQQYTSREYSLQPALDQIVQQIVRWRKRELESWSNLLDLQDQKERQKVHKLWFHLWRMVHHSINNTELKEFNASLLELLNSICLESSLIEFKERLLLLECFYKTLEQLDTDPTIIALFYNTWKFYSQFTDTVDQKIKTIRDPIQRELKDYVRIATWKDVNVFALRESAKRTHYQLAKFVKKYREGLQMPFKQLLASFYENAPLVPQKQSNLVGFIASITKPSVQGKSEGEGRLDKIPQLIKRMQSVTQDYSLSLELEESMHDILDRVQQFQNESKQQKQIKKKAWVDLLKYLQELGLSPRASVKLQQNQDPLYVNSSPKLDFSPLKQWFQRMNGQSVQPLTDKAEKYYYLSLGRIQAVRKLVITVNPDISSLEVEKSISFLDHLMHLSIEQRATLAQVSGDLVQLIKISLGLQDPKVFSVPDLVNLQSRVQELHVMHEQQHLTPTKLENLSQEISHLQTDLPHTTSVYMVGGQTLQETVSAFNEIKSRLGFDLPTLKPVLPDLVQDNQQLEQLVERMMIQGQGLMTQPQLLLDVHQEFTKLSVSKLLQQTLEALNVPLDLSKIRDILRQTLVLVCDRLLSMLILHKTLTKLMYILSNTFYTVIKNGFCAPEEEQEEDTGDADGMGLGQGDGKKDVSDEIEDQEQVEDMQGEQQDQKQHNEEKNAVEMEDDFAGDLQDLELDGEEDNEEEDDKEDEPLEQMGDLDDDVASVVDEKLWDEPVEDDGKTEKNAPVDQQGGEMGAKEDESNEQPKEQDQKDQQEQKDQPEQNDQEKEDKINQEEEFEEDHGIDLKKSELLEENHDQEGQEQQDPLDDDQQEEDGGDQEEEEFQDNQQKDAKQDPTDDPTQVPEDTGDDPMETESLNQELPEDPELEEQMEEQTEDPEMQEQAEDQMEQTEELAEQNEEMPEAQEMQEDQEGEDQMEKQGLESQEEKSGVEQQQKTQSTRTFGVDGDDGGDQDEPDAAGPGQDGQEQGDDAEGEQGPSAKEESVKQDPNPHRSLGDAKENWLSRLRNLSDAQHDNKASDMEDAQMEYVQDDHEDQGTQQALGMADEAMDIDKGIMDEEQQEPMQPLEQEEKQQEAKELKESKSKETKIQKESETGEREPQQQQQTQQQHVDVEMEKQDLDLPKREPKLEVGESQEVQAYEDLRMELEQQMAEWLRGDQKEAHDMWMHYCHLTRDLSFNLCEQLRLILEPTLATKLKGDYKTGKRLNMRKIIPYIASQFKKDKIWLKRTKPAKRDYQIMISIDDSRSMNETHTVQMTLESLVMMTKALQQLEVGELSICSFGEQFRLLHPFEQQFADEQGAGVIQSFTFAQESTNVRLLMDQSLRILEESRQGNMWQLHMILSDGKCEDHEYILSQVRLAQEKNICMVFIILDKNNHLMNMSSVDYDFVDGKPKLKMTRYMDTFPFDYFVVVDHVDKLPGVLAETLRQFFSMVN